MRGAGGGKESASEESDRGHLPLSLIHIFVPAFPAALFPALAQKVDGGMVYGGALRMVGEDERNWGL